MGNTQSGELVADCPVLDCAHSKQLFVVGTKNTLESFSTKNGTRKSMLNLSSLPAASCAYVDPDRGFVATGCVDGRIRLYNSATRKLLVSLPNEGEADENSSSSSSSAIVEKVNCIIPVTRHKCLIGGSLGTVQMWKFDELEPVLTCTRPDFVTGSAKEYPPVYAIYICKDMKTIFVGYEDGKVFAFDSVSGAYRHVFDTGSKSAIVSLSVISQNFLVGGTVDNRMCVWDIRSGQLATTHPVSCVVQSYSKHLDSSFCGGADGRIRVVKIHRATPISVPSVMVLAEFVAVTAVPQNFAFVRYQEKDNTLFAGVGNTIRVWRNALEDHFDKPALEKLKVPEGLDIEGTLADLNKEFEHGIFPADTTNVAMEVQAKEACTKLLSSHLEGVSAEDAPFLDPHLDLSKKLNQAFSVEDQIFQSSLRENLESTKSTRTRLIHDNKPLLEGGDIKTGVRKRQQEAMDVLLKRQAEERKVLTDFHEQELADVDENFEMARKLVAAEWANEKTRFLDRRIALEKETGNRLRDTLWSYLPWESLVEQRFVIGPSIRDSTRIYAALDLTEMDMILALELGETAEINKLSIPKHPNIIGSRSTVDKNGKKYVFSETAGTTLAHVLVTDFKDATERDIVDLVFAVGNAAQHIQSSGSSHRQISPAAITVPKTADGTTYDWGKAMLVYFGESSLADDGTQYVEEGILYAAPETLCRGFCSGSDVWSLGMLLFACLRAQEGKDDTLFFGSTVFDLLVSIGKIAGVPSGDDVEDLIMTTRIPIANQKFLQRAVARTDIVTEENADIRSNIREVLPSASEDAVDLLCKMLRFSPQKRPEFGEVFQHAIFQGMQKPHAIEVSNDSVLVQADPVVPTEKLDETESAWADAVEETEPSPKADENESEEEAEEKAEPVPA